MRGSLLFGRRLGNQCNIYLDTTNSSQPVVTQYVGGTGVSPYEFLPAGTISFDSLTNSGIRTNLNSLGMKLLRIHVGNENTIMTATFPDSSHKTFATATWTMFNTLFAAIPNICNLSTTRLILTGGVQPSWMTAANAIMTLSGAQQYAVMMVAIATQAVAQGCEIFYWEPLNEPNPKMTSAQYAVLHREVANSLKTYATGRSKTYFVGGPCLDQPSFSTWIADMVTTAGKANVDFLSWHFYPWGSGRTPFNSSNGVTWAQYVTDGTTSGTNQAANAVTAARGADATISTAIPCCMTEYNMNYNSGTGTTSADGEVWQSDYRGATWAALWVWTMLTQQAGANVSMLALYEAVGDSRFGVVGSTTVAAASIDPQGYFLKAFTALMPGSQVNYTKLGALPNLAALATVNGSSYGVMFINYDASTSYTLSANLQGLTIGSTVVRTEISSANPTTLTTTIAASSLATLTVPAQSVVFLSPSPAATTTASGVAIPSGWSLRRLDTFGSAGSIPGPVRAHALYYEGAPWTRDTDGTVFIPNGVINNQQQTYQHFEDATWDWATASDHLKIKGRGQGDNSIKSGQLVSKLSSRSFMFEARFTVPSPLGTWVEFWAYGAGAGNDTSEFDVECLMSNDSLYDAHNVSLNNHPYAAPTNDPTSDSAFFSFSNITGLLNYDNPSFNKTTGPHYYTIYYDDTGAGTVRRYIDGVLIYHNNAFKWNQSLGGTGFGPDATMLIDFAAGSGASGGNFPGTIATPSTFSGDMDIYSLSVYTPGAAGRAVPVGEAWDVGFKTPSITLSGGDLVATSGAAVNQLIYGLDPMFSGKYYWEIILADPATCGAGVGTFNSSTTSGQYLGQDNQSVGWFGNGTVVRGGALVNTWATYSTVPQRLGFALHVVPGGVCKLWGRVGTAGNWNNAAIGSQNPATDTGGYTLPFTSYILPAALLSATTDTATLVTASGSWTGTPPSGFGQIGPT